VNPVKGRIREIGRRAAGRILTSARARQRFDGWLGDLYGERLDEIEAACGDDGGSEAYELFRGLDDGLWALLLSRQYDSYPNIRALLPELPEPQMQQLWNGASGIALTRQSHEFYSKLVALQARHGDLPLADARVLDFGCGWGRLTRFLARDVAPGALHGVDPNERALEQCRASRVPAQLGRIDLVPERIPFDASFDLVFAFSVFTHLSEATHLASLRAIHAATRPGGLLVATVRAPAYAEQSEPLRAQLEAGAGDGYAFAPHVLGPGDSEPAGTEATYGETIITLPYVRRHWDELFELLEVSLLVGDLQQVVLTLRRRA